MMKALKITFVVLCIMIALVAGTAYASVDVSNVALGGTGQERGTTVSKAFTIKNDFNSSITIDSITNTAEAKYQLAVSGVTFPYTLGAGDSVSVTLEGYVPEDLDAVDADFNEAKQDIGSLTVHFTESGNAQTATSQITMQAENGLEIAKVKAQVTGETDDTSTIQDGDDLDVRPGDTVSLDIKVENLFSSSSDVDFDNIRVSMDIESDGDFDINDDSDSIDLRAGDDDTVTFDLNVNDDADDKSHTVTLIAQGEDVNGAKQAAVLEFNLNVQRESHDIRITRFDISPDRLLCNSNDDYIDAEVRVENRGRRDESRVALTLEAPSLNFKQTFNDISLDRDDATTKRVLIQLPQGLDSGSYKITGSAFYNDDVPQDTQDLLFTVDQCAEPEPTPTTQPTPEPTTQPPTTTLPPNVVTQPSASSSTVTATATGSGFTSSTAYLVLLVVLIVGVVAAIFGLGVYAMMRK